MHACGSDTAALAFWKAFLAPPDGKAQLSFKELQDSFLHLLGLSVALVAVFLGVVAGGVTAIVLLLSGLRRLGEYLPFGTFLALGGVLAALWGRPLLAWYLG